jgi:hypothetical protein
VGNGAAATIFRSFSGFRDCASGDATINHSPEGVEGTNLAIEASRR